MDDERGLAILGAGGIAGVGTGLCLGLGTVIVADALGASGKLIALHPVVYTVGIVPLICLVSGYQLFKKARAAA